MLKLGESFFWRLIFFNFYFIFYFPLEQKIKEFIKNNLRAPPLSLVQQWGKHLSAEQIQTVNDRIKLRGQLGNYA